MEIRERILTGSQELFFKHGIKSITMDDIAKHLTVSKKTIYQIFADKNQIIEELLSKSLKVDECELIDIQKQSSNVIEEVFHLMKHMSAMFGKVNPNLFYELQKYHPTAWKHFLIFKEEFLTTMVETTISKGIKDGLVRDDINPKLMARLRMEEIEMAMNPLIFPPDKFKIIDVQLALLDHFLHGICTIKGHKLINKYKEIIEEE